MTQLTKAQKAKALEILRTLNETLPTDLLTAREASNIAETYGAMSTKFHRVPKDRQNCEPFNLAQIATEIAIKLKEAR